MSAEFSPSLSPEDIARVIDDDWWLCEAFEGCINVQSVESSTLRIDGSHSSLGNIDQLPPEIQLLIIEQLDFRTLSRLIQTSKKGKCMVEGLLAFVEMMEHAPGVLAALGRTNLVSHHSATSLRQVLRTEKCASCFDFGPLLFLPTCERICPKCLLCNDAFWMTTTSLAKECFSLSDEQLGTIPIMRVIHGTYGFWGIDDHPKPSSVRHLVSAKQVKQLGLQIHGSEEALAVLEPAPPPFVDTSRMLTGSPPRATDEANSYFKRCRRHDFIQRFHSMKLEPPGRRMTDEEMLLAQKSADSFRGIAACKIPFLSTSGPDYGHTCSSCFTFAEDFNKIPDWRQLIPDELKGLSEDEISSYYLKASDIIQTGPEFAEHLKHCPGVPFLLAELDEEDRKRKEESDDRDDDFDDDDEHAYDGAYSDVDDENDNNNSYINNDDEDNEEEDDGDIFNDKEDDQNGENIDDDNIHRAYEFKDDTDEDEENNMNKDDEDGDDESSDDEDGDDESSDVEDRDWDENGDNDGNSNEHRDDAGYRDEHFVDNEYRDEYDDYIDEVYSDGNDYNTDTDYDDEQWE